MTEPVTEARARQLGEFRNILYRSWPNRRDYSFTFTLVNAGWRVYINNSPDYGSRASGSASSHRLGLGARPFICWSPSGDGHAAPIATLSEAQGVAALWADCTENYIVSGRFEPGPGRPIVQDRSVLNGFTAKQTPPSLAVASAASGSRRSSRWVEIRNRLFN
jgi:hypothetical protein